MGLLRHWVHIYNKIFTVYYQSMKLWYERISTYILTHIHTRKKLWNLNFRRDCRKLSQQLSVVDAWGFLSLKINNEFFSSLGSQLLSCWEWRAVRCRCIFGHLQSLQAAVLSSCLDCCSSHLLPSRLTSSAPASQSKGPKTDRLSSDVSRKCQTLRILFSSLNFTIFKYSCCHFLDTLYRYREQVKSE